MLFDHGSELENTLNKTCIIYMMLYMESVADQTDHFANVLARENIANGYDVRKYTVVAILFREIQCKKMIFFCFCSVFSANWAGIR